MKFFFESFFIAVISWGVATGLLSLWTDLSVFGKATLGAIGGGVGAWLGIRLVLGVRKRSRANRPGHAHFVKPK